MNIAIVDKFHDNHNAFSRQIKLPDHNIEYLNSLFDLGKYDLVHFDWCDDLAVAGVRVLESYKSRPRITIRLHAYEAHEDWIKRLNWKVVDALIFVSEHYREIFNKHVTMDKTKQHVIHHGIDLNRYKLAEHPGTDILYVGSLNFKKGPQLLAQAAIALPNHQFRVYGDIQCDRSQIYFDHLALSNLGFSAHSEHIEQIMQQPNYRYILSTSLGESFHLAVAEGMACGLKPLVHDWYGANKLWPYTWRAISSLVDIVESYTDDTPKSCRQWIEDHYSATTQAVKLNNTILGDVMTRKHKSKSGVLAKIDCGSLAICMITKDNFKGVERAVRSCAKYLDALYVAVDDRDTDDTVNKVKGLTKELKLRGQVTSFKAPDPWDFSYARNIAHSMNDCMWALVLDDDEYVLHPEEIPELLENCKDKDVVDVTCGMGVDKYGNVSHAWKFSRFMKNKVRWINARHNIPDATTYSSSTIWTGDIVVVDDKSIRPTDIRAARNEQRETNVEIFRKKVDQNPNDTRSLFYLATAHKESGKYWEAILWYQQYLKTGGWDEERWQAYYDMAECQINLRRYTEARESLYNAIKEKYDRAEAFILMGDVFYECESFYDAMIWYELGCALPYPHDARLFIQRSIYDWERYDKLSMAHHHLENWSRAIENAKKALEKVPGDDRINKNVQLWTEHLVKESTDATEEKDV